MLPWMKLQSWTSYRCRLCGAALGRCCLRKDHGHGGGGVTVSATTNNSCICATNQGFENTFADTLCDSYSVGKPH